MIKDVTPDVNIPIKNVSEKEESMEAVYEKIDGVLDLIEKKLTDGISENKIKREDAEKIQEATNNIVIRGENGEIGEEETLKELEDILSEIEEKESEVAPKSLTEGALNLLDMDDRGVPPIFSEEQILLIAHQNGIPAEKGTTIGEITEALRVKQAEIKAFSKQKTEGEDLQEQSTTPEWQKNLKRIEELRDEIDEEIKIWEEENEKNGTLFVGEYGTKKEWPLLLVLEHVISEHKKGEASDEKTIEELTNILEYGRQNYGEILQGGEGGEAKILEDLQAKENTAKESEEDTGKILVEEVPETPDVLARFEKDFSLAKEDLKEVVAEVDTPEGKKVVRFDNLSDGKKELLLLNLKAFALENAKAEALKNFTENEKARYQNSGRVKKAWLTFSKTYRRAEELSYQERHTLLNADIDKGTYIETLRDMVGMASEGPEVEMIEGKPQFNFLSKETFVEGSFSKEIIEEFNETAGKFARTPAEWIWSKNKEEQRAYKIAKEEYTLARQRLFGYDLPLGGEELNHSFVSGLDAKVQLTQLFNTNPETEKEFAKIVGTKYSRLEGLKAFLGERGKITAMGLAGRAVATIGVGGAVSLLGLGGPLSLAVATGFAGGGLSGGVVGRYLAGKRARMEAEDLKTLTTQENKSAGEVRAAMETKTLTNEATRKEQTLSVGLGNKLELLLELVQEENTPEKKEHFLEMLDARLYFTEQKMASELIAFGEGSEGAKNRYELFRAMARAKTLLEMNVPETAMRIHDFTKGEDENFILSELSQREAEIKRKIDKIFGIHEEAGEEKIRSAKRKGMMTGIFIGGSIGALTSSLAWYHSNKGGSSLIETTNNPKTGSEISGTESSAPNASNIPVEPKPSEIITPTSNPEHLAIQNSLQELGKSHVVIKGDNVWNILKQRLGGNEYFNKLPARQQNFILDELKDKIANTPKSKIINDIGIKSGDPNRIYPGEEIKLDKVFEQTDLEKIFKRAAGIHEAKGPSGIESAQEPPHGHKTIKEIMKEMGLEEPKRTPRKTYSQDTILPHNRSNTPTETILTPEPKQSISTPTKPIFETVLPRVAPRPRYIDYGPRAINPDTLATIDRSFAQAEINMRESIAIAHMENARNFYWGLYGHPPIEYIPAPGIPVHYSGEFERWAGTQLSRQYSGRVPQQTYDTFYKQPIQDQFRRGGTRGISSMLREVERYTGVRAPRIQDIPRDETWGSYIVRSLQAAKRATGVAPRLPNMPRFMQILKTEANVQANTIAEKTATETQGAITSLFVRNYSR